MMSDKNIRMARNGLVEKIKRWEKMNWDELKSEVETLHSGIVFSSQTSGVEFLSLLVRDAIYDAFGRS